jgi:hypothetical protein
MVRLTRPLDEGEGTGLVSSPKGNEMVDSPDERKKSFLCRSSSLEGCQIVAGGRRPPDHDPKDSSRRSSLRYDLRLLAGNPAGCKCVRFVFLWKKNR